MYTSRPMHDHSVVTVNMSTMDVTVFVASVREYSLVTQTPVAMIQHVSLKKLNLHALKKFDNTFSSIGPTIKVSLPIVNNLTSIIIIYNYSNFIPIGSTIKADIPYILRVIHIDTTLNLYCVDYVEYNSIQYL